MPKFNPILILSFFVFFLLGKKGMAQLGCTDAQADNFDATATTNDGSCIYPTTNYTLQEIAILPDVVLETSGLAFFDDQLWTHNDAGNEDKIYQIDTLTGEVLATVIIANSSNTDWEDITEDATHLYVGDFGNNNGNRMDLKIYKFPKSQLASGIATAEVIEFSYADQTDFTVNNNNNDYDCEAFFFHNDSLHLFSKNWVNQKTRHYVIPSQSGTYEAQVRETMDVQGYITGADISEDGVVVLLGYSPSLVNFMWVYFDYQGTDFFSGNKRKILLGSVLNNSQTEAITFRENGYGYISSEKLASLNPKLLSFQTSQWTNGMVTNLDEIELEKSPIRVFPNPSFRNVNVLLEKRGKFEISFLDVNGKILKQEVFESFGNSIFEIEDLDFPQGIYFFRVKNEEQVWIEKVQIIK